MNYKGKKYTIAAGGDIHITDLSTTFTLRGAVQNEDGMRISYDTTRAIVDGESEIKNRIRIRLIDNTKDKPLEEQYAGTDTSTIPFEFADVRTKNKFGLEIIADNEIGAKASYILFDDGKLDALGNYKRSRLYCGTGFVDDTSENKDKFKYTSNLNYIYERARSNGNYTMVQADAGFDTTIAHGVRPEHVVFGNLTLDAKRGRNTLQSGVHYIGTKNMKLSFADIEYLYEANRWNFGANTGLVKGEIMGENVNYFSAGLKAAYKF